MTVFQYLEMSREKTRGQTTYFVIASASAAPAIVICTLVSPRGLNQDQDHC